LAIGSDGGLEMLLGELGAAKIHIVRCAFRFDLDGRVELLHRILVFSLEIVDRAQIVGVVGVGAVQLDCLLEIFLCVAVAGLLHGGQLLIGDAQAVVEAGVILVVADRILEQIHRSLIVAPRQENVGALAHAERSGLGSIGRGIGLLGARRKRQPQCQTRQEAEPPNHTHIPPPPTQACMAPVSACPGLLATGRLLLLNFRRRLRSRAAACRRTRAFSLLGAWRARVWRLAGEALQRAGPLSQARLAGAAAVQREQPSGTGWSRRQKARAGTMGWGADGSSAWARYPRGNNRFPLAWAGRVAWRPGRRRYQFLRQRHRAGARRAARCGMSAMPAPIS